MQIRSKTHKFYNLPTPISRLQLRQKIAPKLNSRTRFAIFYNVCNKGGQCALKTNRSPSRWAATGFIVPHAPYNAHPGSANLPWHLQTCTHTYTHALPHITLHSQLHLHLDLPYPHMQSHIHIHIYMYIYIYIYFCSCICMYIYIYICILHLRYKLHHMTGLVSYRNLWAWVLKGTGESMASLTGRGGIDMATATT